MTETITELLENINDAFILLNKDFNIITFNSKAKNVISSIDLNKNFDITLFNNENKSEGERLLNEITNNNLHKSNQNFVFNFNDSCFLLNIKKLSSENILILFNYFDDNYFKKILDTSDTGIVLVDPNKEGMPCIYTNKAFINKSGYKKDEIIGKNLSFLRCDESDTKERETLKKSIENKTPCGVVLKNKKANGDIFYNKIFITPLINDYNNRVQLFLGIQSDITTQVSEHFVLDSIFNNTYSKILVIKNRKLYKANRIFLDIFGFEDENDFNEKHKSFCEMFLDVADKNSLKPLMNGIRWSKYVNENPEKIHKLYLKAKDESIKIYQVKCFFSEEFDEEIITLNDITQLEERNELIEKQSKFAAMGEMISMIAHQWRQPLQTIKLIIDKLYIMNKLNTLNSSLYIENHTKMSEIIAHMSQTIEDFRNFFDNKDFKNNITLKELVLKAYNINKVNLQMKKIDFIFDTNSLEDKNIFINISKFTQVLLNLFKNSIDEFSEKVVIDKTIKIRLEEDSENFIINFLDNAGGIQQEFLEKIFEPYFSTKSKNGTGIGLYMCKMIIEEQMFGKISVSNYLYGANFTIKLPKYEIY